MTDDVKNADNDAILKEFRKAVDALTSLSTELSYPVDFQHGLEAIALAFDLLDWATHDAGPCGGDLPEVLVYRLRNPDALAQWLMAELSGPMSDCERFTAEEKAHWIKAAGYMGPDWIAKLKRVAAFMDKAESF